MRIYPAIDIKEGKCVRLERGDFDKATVFNESPAAQAAEWARAGASVIHVVDLDGARFGAARNNDIIAEIVKLGVPVQTGGGIRSFGDIEAKLSVGVSRVVLGTSAVNDKPFLKEAVKRYGGAIVAGIDAKNGFAATHGWNKVSGADAFALCREMEEVGVETIVYTNIARDGMLSGVDIESTKTLIGAVGANVIASGGVSGADDLARLKLAGAYGVIIGKALYTGALDLAEIIAKYEVAS
jgi:phosphoribosylformimino-5-aminoimidazole carboxamide ribotide isomerase